MGSDKTYIFDGGGSGGGLDIAALVSSMMGNKGMDPNLVAALMNGNNNRGAWGGAGAGAGANALATAEALSIIANSGRNGQVCPQPVALYQPAMPCSCNTCGN